MHKPPFKLASPSLGFTSGHGPVHSCDADDRQAAGGDQADAPTKGRGRLAQMDPHLHCSVIGTCLGTAELRRLMARFLEVQDLGDLEVHHEAVRRAGLGGPEAKALNKALDHRHQVAVLRFARVRGSNALGTLWEEASRRGEIPGAYWAVLTHRDATPELRQRVFGEVHMLSHLVGAANRADLRRLVALEKENAGLRDRNERQQLRFQELVEERDRKIDRLEQDSAELRRSLPSPGSGREDAMAARVDSETVASLVGLHTQRRERAEQAAADAEREAARLNGDLDHLKRHMLILRRELSAAEMQLRQMSDAGSTPDRHLEERLRGRRILYVGGRPSSTPAIRDLVLRHGGEFQRHDGGPEDRKGLLASAVAWAQTVVFPVDCIDHDSANNLKRHCVRQGIPFHPLRNASVASFAAALSSQPGSGPEDDSSGSRICLKHG
jgi:uncharacterized protein DUF2325